MTVFHRSIIIKYTQQPSNPIAVSYTYGQKTKYRITLELDVQDDFNPRQIDWDKLLDIQENESCQSYIEDLNIAEDLY